MPTNNATLLNEEQMLDQGIRLATGETLGMGDLVQVNREIDLSPHTIIREGEIGRVVLIDPDGYAEIRMREYHKGLAEWDNCIWLIPPYTDDEILSALTKREDAWQSQRLLLFAA